MGGSHQIDVVCSLFLKLKENVNQPFGRYFTAAFGQCNIVILAEAALQVATAEKNSAGTGASADAGLLPKVEGSSGGVNFGGSRAEAGLSGQTVRMTVSGADSTVLHLLIDPFPGIW